MAWPTTPPAQRGYGYSWTKLRKRILERDNYLCQPCLLEKGIVHPASEVDHKIPKSQGGTDDDENLWAINSQCHKDKTIRENGGTPKAEIGLDGWPIG